MIHPPFDLDPPRAFPRCIVTVNHAISNESEGFCMLQTRRGGNLASLLSGPNISKHLLQLGQKWRPVVRFQRPLLLLPIRRICTYCFSRNFRSNRFLSILPCDFCASAISPG